MLNDFLKALLVFTVTRSLAERHASLLFLGILGAVFSTGNAVSAAVGGRLSDRFGRRAVMIAGASIALLSALGCLLFAPDSSAWLASYCMIGVGSGFLYPPLVAWLNQSHDPRSTVTTVVNRNLILFSLAWNVGVFSGQFAGGWLMALGRSIPVALAAAASVANGVLVFSLRHRSDLILSTRRMHIPPGSLHRLETAVHVTVAWLANLGSTFSLSMILHLFPRLVVDLGLPSSQHGTLLVGMRIANIAMCLFLYRSRFWHFRFYPTVVAQLIGALGLLLLYTAKGPGALAGGLVALGVLVGYNYFTSLYYANVASAVRRRGLASGLQQAVLASGPAVGSLAGGISGTLAGERMQYVLALAAIGVVMFCQVLTILSRAGKPSVGRA